jgi:regulator of sigma E protease
MLRTMTVAYYVVAALGLALLMIVHEGGHYFAARRYGMRVIKFSIGFGPRIWHKQPKGSPTVFQVAIIPFLAYVQIAGMNPYEDQDPNDKGSYANASLWARVVTITAGPLANYLFASVLFFGALVVGVTTADETSMKVVPSPDGPAARAGFLENDKIVAINGNQVHDWSELQKAVSAHAGDAIDVGVDRGGEPLHITVTPNSKGAKDEGRILIHPIKRIERLGVREAAVQSITRPPQVVVGLVVGLTRLIMRKDKVEASGPVGITKDMAAAAKDGPGDYLFILGVLSAYLGGFNLLPFPALDGGRLIFLGAEAASRRKPDRKMEARVHAIGLLMMLALIAIVTVTDLMPKH